MARPGTSLRRRWLVALLALEIAWGGFYVLRTGFVVEGQWVSCLWDDAMVAMRYARNLAGGDGLVWNAGGERVQGFSSPAVAFTMAVLQLLPVGARHVSLLFQLLALSLQVGSIALLWCLSRRIAPEHAWLAPAAVLGFVLCAPVQLWALQGADTAFVGAWLLACLAALARRGTAPRHLPVLLAVGAAIRLDATVFALAMLVAWGLRERPPVRRALAAVLPLAAAWAVILAASWFYYGEPLPNVVGLPRDLPLRADLASPAAWLAGLAPVVALAVFGAVRRRREPAVFAAALCILVGFFRAAGAWGDPLGADGASRAAAPTLPLLLLLAIDGAGALFAGAAARLPARLRPGLALAASGALALLASPPTARVEWLDPRRPTLLQAMNLLHYRYALFLRESTRPDTSIAVQWPGVTPYFSERPSLDLLGRPARGTAGPPGAPSGADRADPDWDAVLREIRPDLFVEPGQRLVDRPDFRSAYFESRSRDGLAFFVRRDALAKLLDPTLEIIHLPPRSAERRPGGV